MKLLAVYFSRFHKYEQKKETDKKKCKLCDVALTKLLLNLNVCCFAFALFLVPFCNIFTFFVCSMREKKEGRIGRAAKNELVNGFFCFRK